MWSEVYRQTYAFEDHHWWFRAQRRLTHWAIRSLARPPANGASRLLDIGVGGGATLVTLSAFGHAIGLDYSHEAIGYARRRPEVHTLCRGTADALPFKPHSLDVVTILNVLCHQFVRDDQAVLRQAWEALRPGGLLIVTDPAYNWIRRHHDIVEMTVRRYTAGGVVRNVQRAGFHVERAGYMYSFILPAILWQAAWDHAVGRHQRPTSDLTPPPRWLNALLDRMCRVELRILQRLPPPFGSTVFCVGRRP